MQGRWLLLSLVLAGCQEATSALPQRAAPISEELAQDFDPARTGTLRGQVVWKGAAPTVAPFMAYKNFDILPLVDKNGPRENPHVPRIDPATGGVGEAIVFLRRVDLRRSKPWDHAPVSIECPADERDRIVVQQGDTRSSVGFVRRGDKMRLVNRQPWLHIIEGVGPSFFAIPLATTNAPSERMLDKPGHVDISSGSGYHWLRAHVHVSDHPYWARTDAAGRFTLPQTPAGTYEVVCWHPRWHVERRDHDPESGLVSRVFYRPPLELVRTATVAAHETVDVPFTLTSALFDDSSNRERE